MAAVHQVALATVLLERLPAEERARTARLASELSAESFVPFEITARATHEANAMLTELNATLASKSDEIRRQLEELRQLQALKDDLISLVVHDLRNPLAGVLSCLNLIEPSSADAETREFLKLAREGMRKLSELVDDMLEVRLLEEGKLALKPEPVSLVEILRQAIATLEASAKLEGIPLELKVEAEPTLSLDRRLVRRSIENLISNALKFSKPGEPIVITVRSDPEGTAVEVADRGPGLPEELRDRLFQKFASVEARARGARRGHGLGLYVVKLVATAHGGSVAASARPGGGTVFRVLFPRSNPTTS
jgi:signal transduction histidine kinase